MSSIKFRYKLRTVVFGPGSFLLYGLQMIQGIDMSIRIQGGGKLMSQNCFQIDRSRREHVPEVKHGFQ